MKKLLYLTTIVLCLLCLLALTACFSGGSDETEPPATDTPAHEHVWDAGTVTKTGSCNAQTKEETEKGEIMYTCTVCGATKTEETSGHTWDEGRVLFAADCTHEGETLYTCTFLMLSSISF